MSCFVLHQYLLPLIPCVNDDCTAIADIASSKFLHLLLYGLIWNVNNLHRILITNDRRSCVQYTEKWMTLLGSRSSSHNPITSRNRLLTRKTKKTTRKKMHIDYSARCNRPYFAEVAQSELISDFIFH